MKKKKKPVTDPPLCTGSLYSVSGADVYQAAQWHDTQSASAAMCQAANAAGTLLQKALLPC